MVKERKLEEIKARISNQIRKMAYNGFKIVLFEWKEKNLRIHTTDNENVIKIASFFQRRFPGWLSTINVSVCGDSRVMRI
ncbi:MAG: hypothetical protein JW881_08465 [Spirochaetales bacterium]|nr:hypothetical protein [Spirochaetales bacterium]